MRWTPGGRSDDLEDRRDEGGGGIGGAHIGIGGFLILLVLSLVFKRDFFSLIGNQGALSSQPARQVDTQRDAKEEPTVQFVSFVLDDVQKTWGGILQTKGVPYQHAKLVLFRDLTSSGCGTAQTETGPFYCPADAKVYIDLGFYDELQRRFGAPGQFAQAYVLAHELDIMCRTCSASSARFATCKGRIRAPEMKFRFAWNCRRIAWLECGRTQPNSATCSKLATCRVRLGPPPQ